MRRLTSARLGRSALWVLDVLTVGALLGTGEVDLRLLAVLAVAVLTRALGGRIRSRWALLAVIVLVLAAAVVAIVEFRIHPLITVAHGAILVHALLWLGPDEVRDRVPRLAMSFVNLVLAAALTTEFYLLPVILAVSVLGSIYISAAFLETSFQEAAPELLEAEIPAGFLRNMVFVSLAIFVVSLALFPIIPRANWRSMDDESAVATTAYRESVELAASNSEGLRRSFKPALEIRCPGAAPCDPLRSLPGRLLRGKDLELFDGTRWIPRARKRVALSDSGVSENRDKGDYVVTLRPQLRGHRFHPYGARMLPWTRESDELIYEYVVNSTGDEEREAPYELHLRVPEEASSPELEGLARSLFSGLKTARDKVQALSRFFRNGFQAGFDPQPDGGTAALVGNFLLREKKGRCELFATASALLLRLGGVPSRVVAGYRASRFSRGAALEFTEGDAHAWIEYWDPQRGWAPFDPTPVVLVAASWLEPLRAFYWDLDQLWGQWVLNYRKKSSEGMGAARFSRHALRKLKEAMSELNAASSEERVRWLELFGAVGLGLGFLGWSARWLWRRRAGGRELSRGLRQLRRECRRMAELLGVESTAPVTRNLELLVRERFGVEAVACYREWETMFLRLRYGETPAADARELASLAGWRAAITRINISAS